MSAKDKLEGAGRFARDNISNVERMPPEEKPAAAVEGKPPRLLVLAIGFFAVALAAFVLAVALFRNPT